MSTVYDIAEASLIQDMQRLNTISNNLANVSTIGYKRDISVQTRFDNALDGASASDAVSAEQAVSAKADLSQGVLRNTGNALDVAIEGEAFFEVVTTHGQFYTRQGNFHADAEGKLVDAAGRTVSGVGGDILIHGGQPQIKDDGQVWVGTENRGQIKLIRFDNLDALTKVGTGMYQTSQSAIEANGVNGVRLRQGYVEGSNVDPTREMVNLITVTRHFESVQKVLSTYDQMMDSAIKSIGEV